MMWANTFTVRWLQAKDSKWMTWTAIISSRFHWKCWAFAVEILVSLLHATFNNLQISERTIKTTAKTETFTIEEWVFGFWFCVASFSIPQLHHNVWLIFSLAFFFTLSLALTHTHTSCQLNNLSNNLCIANETNGNNDTIKCDEYDVQNGSSSCYRRTYIGSWRVQERERKRKIENISTH